MNDEGEDPSSEVTSATVVRKERSVCAANVTRHECARMERRTSHDIGNTYWILESCESSRLV